MSTGQTAMMLCGWGVKAGMWVLPYLSALENAIVFKGTLQIYRFTLLYFIVWSINVGLYLAEFLAAACVVCRRCSRAFEAARRRSVERQARLRVARRVDAQPETQAHAETGTAAVEDFRRESRDFVVRPRALRRRHRRDDDSVDTVFLVDAFIATTFDQIHGSSPLQLARIFLPHAAFCFVLRL